MWATLAKCAPKSTAVEWEWIESLGENGDVHLLICADTDPVGTIGLNQLNEVWAIAELGYYVHPDHQGNGYATDATRRPVRYPFDDRRLEKIYANVIATNVRPVASWSRSASSERASFVITPSCRVSGLTSIGTVCSPPSSRSDRGTGRWPSSIGIDPVTRAIRRPMSISRVRPSTPSRQAENL